MSTVSKSRHSFLRRMIFYMLIFFMLIQFVFSLLLVGSLFSTYAMFINSYYGQNEDCHFSLFHNHKIYWSGCTGWSCLFLLSSVLQSPLKGLNGSTEASSFSLEFLCLELWDLESEVYLLQLKTLQHTSVIL